MPPARSSAARTAPQRQRPQRATPGFQPRRVTSRAPLSRIRWDRASRVGMVAVLGVIAVLWISGISSLLGSHAQAERGLTQVRTLSAQRDKLLAEEKALGQKATILSQARSLGMVKKGEQSFIVTH